ncbi:hypothetical protein Tco_1040306, partial [Tanacetum coccineum]
MTTLLMALPEDHLAKFHKMTDAKEMWDAIKSRFGGNDESKKMQKFQSLLSQLEIHGAGVSTEDANQKFLRSLPSAWSQVSLIMRTKPGVDSLSFDDLYNNLRVFENDVKGSTASSSSSQNVAFVSENTSSTNDVSTAYSVSNTSGQNPQYEQTSSYSLLANQSSCPQLDHEDLEQLDEYDLEEMDLKWRSDAFIEEYESDSDDEYVFNTTKEQETLVFANQQVKTPRETVKNQFTHSQKPKVDKKELGYGFTIRACFVCGSLNHLIRDCDFHEKRMARKVELNNKLSRNSGQREIRPIWNNVQRINKQNQFVPAAVLTRTGKIPVNTAKASGTKNVSTARQSFNNQAVLTSTAMKVNTVKPIVNRLVLLGEKGKLLLSPQQVVIGDHKDTTGTMSPNTMVDPVLEIDYPHRALKNKGIVDSGCSRHMTGNKAYLAEFQDFNGGPVAFGGSKGYITGKGGLACLIAKATFDESNKWHRRLGHDYPHIALKNKGIVDSRCSRHMTGNKVYFAEFQDFNGGPVAFGGSKGYITGKDPQEAKHNAGTEDIIDVGDSEKEDESVQDCFVLPIWSSYSSTITPDLKTDEKREGPKEEEQVFLDDLERVKRQEKDANEAAEALRKEFAQATKNLIIQAGAAKASNTNIFSTVSTPAKASSTNQVNTVSTPVSTASPHDGLYLSDPIHPEQDDSEIPPLEDIHQNSTD